MDISRTIKDILFLKNLTLTQLNDLLNKKNDTNYSVQNLSRKLISDNLKFKDVEDMLDVLGYSLEIVENKQLKMPLDEIAVTKIDDTDRSCEEVEEEYDIGETFQGTSKLDAAIDKWFNKYVEKRIEFKAKELIERQFPAYSLKDNDKPDLIISGYELKKRKKDKE